MGLLPIKLQWQPITPNPAKVIIIPEELGLPYESVLTNVHTPESKAGLSNVNPNGRLPAIHDPNTGITLWESGAIIFYLIDKYDTEGRISYGDGPQKYETICWQQLQASGQGPYYGQAAWFIMFHNEPLVSAQVRYSDEIKRVVAVLDKRLVKSEYLVGSKLTYADLSFGSWDASISLIFEKGPKNDWNIEDYPNFKRWHQSLIGRPTFQKAMAAQTADQAQKHRHKIEDQP